MTPEQEAARLFAGGAPIVLSDGRTIVRDPENPGRAFVIPRAPTLAEMFARTTEEIREQSPFMFSSMLGGCGPVLDRMAKRAQAFEVEQHGGLLLALSRNTGSRSPADMLPREHPCCSAWCEADAVLELRQFFRDALYVRDIDLADTVLAAARAIDLGPEVEAWHDGLLDEATAPV